MSKIPLFIDLKGRKCLITGGGNVALRRCQSLLRYDADITIIAPECQPELLSLASQQAITLRLRHLELSEDIKEDYFLVVCATDDHELNRRTAEVCRAKNVEVNLTDSADDSSIIFPAVRSKGLLTAAFSTGGASPQLAALLADSAAEAWPQDIDRQLEKMKRERMEAKTAKIVKNEACSSLLAGVNMHNQENINNISNYGSRCEMAEQTDKLKNTLLRSDSVLLNERPRRLRQAPLLRQALRQTVIEPAGLIYPIFIRQGEGIREEIPAMPGITRFSPDMLSSEIERITEVGVSQVLLFGIVDDNAKNEAGSAAWDNDGPVQRAIRIIKKQAPHMIIWADICLCEYTDHGHCGLIGYNERMNRDEIENDSTLKCLARAAISCARAGADGVAPSDMMDGRIGYMRRALDNEGFIDCLIMSYSAKFASGFYGPFREAAGSAPVFGDRCSYQLDPANSRDALREIRLDLDEGADVLMVKPALAYHDIIRQSADISDRPIAAYHVSGEYSMIRAAAMQGWIDERKVVLESLLASRRAGASLLITYHAPAVCAWLRQKDI